MVRRDKSGRRTSPAGADSRRRLVRNSVKGRTQVRSWSGNGGGPAGEGTCRQTLHISKRAMGSLNGRRLPKTSKWIVKDHDANSGKANGHAEPPSASVRHTARPDRETSLESPHMKRRKRNSGTEGLKNSEEEVPSEIKRKPKRARNGAKMPDSPQKERVPSDIKGKSKHGTKGFKKPDLLRKEALPPEHARKISTFHALEKRIAASKDPVEIARLRLEQEKLGGLEAYQLASITGGDKTKGGETGKFFAKTWMELKGKDPIRLLDVGAIHGTTYEKFPWIQATSIDLNPLGPTVIKSDFFDFPVPKNKEELYDVVSLSLVINFVGSLPARAEMLRRAHRFLKPDGHLFVVLPLACLTNSRYVDHERFRGILKTLGWEPVVQHDSAKLTHWLLQRCDGDGKEWKRQEVRGGAKRNNFCIVVKK